MNGELISVAVHDGGVTDLYFRAEGAKPLTVDELKVAVGDFIEGLKGNPSYDKSGRSLYGMIF